MSTEQNEVTKTDEEEKVKAQEDAKAKAQADEEAKKAEEEAKQAKAKAEEETKMKAKADEDSFVYVFPLSYDKSTFAMLSINLSTGISKKILFASTYVGVIVIAFTALFS